MYEKLIKILNEDQEKLEQERIALSKRQSNIREVYDRIKPKKNGNIITDDFLIYLNKNNQSKLYKCIDEIGLVDDVNIKTLNKLIGNKNEYLEFIKYIKSENAKAGIPNDLIFTEKFRTLISSLGNEKLMMNYEQIYDVKLKLDSANEQLEKILIDISKRIISEYELILEEKELKKEEIKKRKYILQKLTKVERLLPRELLLLTTKISECEDTNLRKELQEELDLFNKTIAKKNNISTIKVIEEHKKVQFVDKETIIETKDNITYIEPKESDNDIYKNHLFSLSELSSKEEVFEYLDSMRYMNNFDIIIIKMINAVKDNTTLQEILKEYTSLLEQVEVVDSKEENKIFYYGVTHDKNYLLSDLKNIPEELYPMVNNAINNIRLGKFKKSSTIQSVKKINKIRDNDIRVAYKRISDSNYIIVGIYLKKDSKGYDIINSIKSRGEPILYEERAINDAINSETLQSSLYEKNSMIEEELKSKLKPKVK